jgi:hypothetical protein
MISIILPYLFGIGEEAPSILLPRTKKRAGELAEAFFLSKAESLNFHVSKPWETAIATTSSSTAAKPFHAYN